MVTAPYWEGTGKVTAPAGKGTPMVAAPYRGGDGESDSSPRGRGNTDGGRSLQGRGQERWQLPSRDGTGKVAAPAGNGTLMAAAPSWGRGHRQWHLPAGKRTGMVAARTGTMMVPAPCGERDTNGGSSLPGRGPGR